MKIGIYTRNIGEGPKRILVELIKLLENMNIQVALHANCRELLGQDFPNNIPAFESAGEHNFECLICIGGDGTVLDTLHIVRKSGIPVLGINVGRLGFLASVQEQDLQYVLNKIVEHNYFLDKRTVLSIETDIPMFGDFPYALNDFVLHKKDSASMITVNTYLNGEFLNAYWSDGLITASPTGSTGYSLSCGGPILFPQSSSLVLTPIAPHNLNVRPAVLSDDNVISYEIIGRNDSILATIDSKSVSIKSAAQLAVRRANFTFNMMRFHQDDYLNTLRGKLLWGLDNRNLV
ncbi:MAG: NAD kinase [Bacteroidetes bacterium MED-G17]|nr:MAG: NAD kinase [Bacteroidetes bacterium TMED39]PDH52197.1 MAG: NAD kinase [Bacteroidetes bacterium MED-G17]|tara:strand:- start:29904 stop:30776 length:873 start_codon:yes stop_codon:yes gene_type:complete